MSAAARVLLGLVFLVSGTLKLRDPGWPSAATILGVPRPVVGLVAPGEIVLGALLAAGVASTTVEVVALVVLLAFTAVLGLAARRPVGERPVCACFGRWSARAVDRWSVLRNVGFIALAVAALAG